MRAADRLGRLVRNPVAVVGAIVLACFALTTHYALRFDDWRVMTDELLYVKLARSIADGFSPLPEVNGEYTPVFSQLFPLLLAPFEGLLSAPAAYEAGHVLNALLMASTAIPAYLLVRSLGLPRLAGYLVAALTVSVPWLGMATIMWTESVGYPAFAWAILALHRSMVAPSARNDLFVLGALALAFVARTQFIFLVGVAPVAILLHEVGYGMRGRSVKRSVGVAAASVRSHRTLAVAYGVLVIGAVILAATRGLDAALGTYSVAATGELWPEGAWQQTWSHAASVTVAIGIAPAILAVGWAAASVIRPSRRRLHAFAVIVVLVVPALALMVGSFTARYSPGNLQDRYLFYVVPVLFAGMAACLLDPRRRWLAVAVAGVGFYLIADSVSYDDAGFTSWFASPSTWVWRVFEGQSDRLGSRIGLDGLSPVAVVEVGALMITAILAAALWRRPPSRGLLVLATAPVLAFCVFETNYILDRGSNSGGGGNSITGDIAIEDRDWIDEALPPDGDAAILPTWVGDDLTTAQRTWWQAEFWNKRINRQVVATEGSYTPFPRQEMAVDFATGRVALEGEEVPYLVVAQTERRFRLAIRRSLAKGFGYLEVIEPRRPYRAVWTTKGISPDGWTHPGPVRIRLHHGASDPSEARRVMLTLSAVALPTPRVYRIRGAAEPMAGVLSIGEVREVPVTVCLPPRGPAEIELDVPQHSELERDGRVVGLRVLRIDEARTSAGCGSRSLIRRHVKLR